MKKFIDFCILFALYVYTTHIVEDWSIFTKFGRIYYYPGWLYKSILTWLICPIFIPEYWFKQTSLYAYIKKMQDSPEYKAQMSKTMNNFNM